MTRTIEIRVIDRHQVAKHGYGVFIMAKYSITHSCGHSQTHQLFGPTASRDSYLERLVETNCSDCNRTAKTSAAVEAAQEMGLPPLTGSEKQIAWAESIRVEMIECFERAEKSLLELVAKDGFSAASILEVGDAVALLSTELLGQSESRWWIDNRSTRSDYRDLLEKIQSRGLVPSMVAEHAALKAARKAEAQASLERAHAVVKTIRIAPDTVSHSEGITTVEDGCRKVVQLWSGSYDLFDAAGPISRRLSWQDIHQERRFDKEVAEALDQLREAEAKARADALITSLAGCSVASAIANNKRSGNLAAVLSDGRIATGHHTAKGTVIEGVAGQPLPSDHPEAVRLAAEARKVVTRG